MFRYLIKVLCICYGYVVAAQTTLEPSLSLTDLARSERFRSNARLTINGIPARPAAWETLSLPENPVLKVTFRKDSATLETVDTSGNQLLVSFPNDITLLTNADRKELQERLLALLKQNAAAFRSQPGPERPVWVNTTRSGSRFGLLSSMNFSDSVSQKPVCHRDFAMYSLINSLSDTLTCDGLFPVRLVLHRYGNATDTLSTSVAGILKSTGAAGWSKWSGVESNELTVLLQHPFVGYEHLLFFRRDKSADRWLADLYPFIPTHNLSGLFTAYSSKSRQERFRIIK